MLLEKLKISLQLLDIEDFLDDLTRNPSSVVIFVAVMFAILIGIFIFSQVFLNKVLHQDDNIPLESHKCKILEKTRDAGTIAWYSVEFETGERKLLRNIKPNALILTAGDKGVMEIRGETICTFKRDVG